MKRTISFLVLLLIFSCAVRNYQNGFSGDYYKESPKGDYRLQLNDNNTFRLEITYPPHSKSSCVGTWKFDSAESIVLNCSEESTEAQLASSYLGQREWKAVILSQRKVKIGEHTLKRK